MSVLNKNMFRVIALLCVILALASFNAKAALPDAGTAIGTIAVVDYEVDGQTDRSESNLVTTTIAQVYATKIDTFNGAVGKAGEDVDIHFAVRNIGNGSDDVTLAVSALSNPIASFKLLSADSNGVADESNSKAINMGASFSRNGMARDQVHHFVARVSIPAGTAAGDMKFEIAATNKGKSSQKNTAQVIVKIVDDKHFIVEPGADAMLDDAQKTVLAFKVKGGTETGSAYFELSVTKKTDPATPVKFKVQDGKIAFNGQNIESSKINATDTKTAFDVDAVAARINTDFKMQIEIPGAKRGDEYLMHVKYGKSKADTSLTQSRALQIGYTHAMQAPLLAVTANSANAGGDHSVIADAVSGETVDYTLTLKNQSTRPENFSLELSSIAAAIRDMSLVDENGNKFGAASGSGLPETGLIAAGKTITFKLKLALTHGIAADTAEQKLKLTVKSMTEPKTGAVAQDFSIAKVVAVQKPAIAFFADKTTNNAVTALTVPGRDDIAGFYMEIAAPAQSKAQREYQIRFDMPNTTFQTVKGDTMGSAMPAMAVKLGNGAHAGMFLVKADMRGLASLTATVTVIDVLSGQTETATITLNKEIAIGFAETGYSGKGAADLDTLVTLNVINHGRAIKEGDYVIAADVNAEWNFAFSTNGKDWEKTLLLPKMKPQDKQAVQVKIRVPKGVKAGAIESLKLVLRKTGTKQNEAEAFVTLSIGKSKLLIAKTVAVMKNSAKGPKNFVEKSTQEVEHGDTIWYRVVVTNPVDAPAAKRVTVTDPLPKHTTFGEITTGAAKAKATSDNVTMNIGDMQPGESKTLEYSVVVELPGAMPMP
jgi:uncharacterized repeat protein (TIGR01451 family)